MTEKFSLETFVEIMKNCRARLIDDVLNGNPELYQFLYAPKNSIVGQLYREKYELRWLKIHWEECKIALDDSRFSRAAKVELLKIFLQWYQRFVKAWGYSSSDAFFFDPKIESLEKVLETNRNLKETLDRFQISILREEKILNQKIEEAVLNG